MEESESSTSRPTMDQLEAEAGLTWDDALARLKDLEKTLKYEIQTNIREMKLCMTSNKIEDVSIKAAKLHDIRRTLASSRALVREECAIMKEFEKIKGILGACRVMDEDDWSTTKNQTRYWGDKLAEVRRRQRRISGDVVDLDSVVSDILTRSDFEADDSLDSLDNLSLHLTNYPLFNNAPYGHHLSVPSRPESAMSDVSAVSTGIAGYFKGRDTTDMSNSEAESSVTPSVQRKKLFTNRSGAKEPSLDGSEFEDEKGGPSMQELYLREKRKSALAFKKKALAERDANVKAIEDHEGGAEADGYYTEDIAKTFDPSRVHESFIEGGYQAEQEDFEENRTEDPTDEGFEMEQKLMEEEKQLEASLRREQEEEEKQARAEEAKKKEAEEQRKRMEKEKLRKQVEERKRIEAEEKEKMEAERKKKLEDKKKKEIEKQKKMEAKKKKEEEKTKKLEAKKKKEEEKSKKLADQKEKEDNKMAKETHGEVAEGETVEGSEDQREENESKMENVIVANSSHAEDTSSDPLLDIQDVKEEAVDSKVQKPKRSKEQSKEDLESKIDKSLSQSGDNIRDTPTEQDLAPSTPSQLEDKSHEESQEFIEKESASQEITKKNPIKSRSQSKENNSHVKTSSSLEESFDAMNQKTVGQESMNGSKSSKSRSQSREGRGKGLDKSAEDQSQESMGSTKKKLMRSRSQSKENKSRISTSPLGEASEVTNQKTVGQESKNGSKQQKSSKSRSQSREGRGKGLDKSAVDMSQCQESIEKEGDSHETTKKQLMRSQSKENNSKNILTSSVEESSEDINQKGVCDELKDGFEKQKSFKSRSESRESRGKGPDTSVPTDEGSLTTSLKDDHKETRSEAQMSTIEDHILGSKIDEHTSNDNSQKVDMNTEDMKIIKPQRKKGPKSKEIENATGQKSRSQSRDGKTKEISESNFETPESRDVQHFSEDKLETAPHNEDQNADIIPGSSSHGQYIVDSEDNELEANEGIFENKRPSPRKTRSRLTKQSSQIHEEESKNLKSRSQSREKIKPKSSEQVNEECPHMKSNEDDTLGKSPIKSRSQSRDDKKREGVNDDPPEQEFFNLNEPITKPKRNKSKQKEKENQITDSEIKYSLSMEVQGDPRTSMRAGDDSYFVDEENTVSELVEEAPKRAYRKSRSHSRESKGNHFESPDKIPSHSKSDSSKKGEVEENGEEGLAPRDGPPIIKPKRKKGKGKKQSELSDSNILDHRFVESFKDESPDYAEIDYEKAQTVSHNQMLCEIQGTSALKEKQGFDSELEEGHNQEGSLSMDNEPIYAQVQKKRSSIRISEDEMEELRGGDSDMRPEEPLYAEVKKSISSRNTSRERQKSSGQDEVFEEPWAHDLGTKTSRQASRERKETLTDLSMDESVLQKKDARSVSRDRNKSGERQASRERKERMFEVNPSMNENFSPRKKEIKTRNASRDREITEDRQDSREGRNENLISGDPSRNGIIPKKPEVNSRRSRSQDRREQEDERDPSKGFHPDLEPSMTPEGDFWFCEDQMDVSSTGIPDMASVKKPERKSRKKDSSSSGIVNEESDASFGRTHKTGGKGLAADPGLQKYLAQNKSLNMSVTHPFEFQDDALEQFEGEEDYQMSPNDDEEEEEDLDINEANEFLMGENEAGYGSDEFEKEFSRVSNHLSPTGEHFGNVEEMERPLSALGQYSGEESSSYPEYGDDLLSYRDSGLIREKPDGMDREELCHFDPSQFRQGRKSTKDYPEASSTANDNYGQKINNENCIGANQIPGGGRSTSRERPNNLNLTDLRPRDKQQLSGLFKDEIHLDEMDLQKSMIKAPWKKPMRRRRTVSQSFDSEIDEYDDEEFDSDAKNYPTPPLLQPPPRKNRSRSGSASPLPKERENIGPKLERMFSTGEDSLLEFEYDDDGVKKMKKVSFAAENEQFVLRPDPEVRSIPGTKLFTFAPSKTHEQPSDLRQRGRQKKTAPTKKRSNSADVFPSWNKNSALNFLKSMTSFSNGASNQEEDLHSNPEGSESAISNNYKFEEAFAAANENRAQPSSTQFDDVIISHPSSVKSSKPLNDYLDNMMTQNMSSPSTRTTQSLDNVNLQGNQILSSSLQNRPSSSEPNSIAGSTYQSPDKKQSSIFGNMISRAKSLSRSSSRQNSEERSIFKNLFQPKSTVKNGGSKHKRSLSFDGLARKISSGGGGSSSNKTVGEPSVVSTEENYHDMVEPEFCPESAETESFMNRLKTKKPTKASVDKTDFDKLFARGLALSAEKEKELMDVEGQQKYVDHHRPTTPFEVFSKDEVFKKSQQGAGISFEEKVKYFLDDLSHQPHTSTFQAPMNCSPVAAAAAVAAMAPPRSTISPGTHRRGGPLTLSNEPSKPKESPHQFLRRAEEFVKQAEVDTEYSQPVWPAIIQSPEDLPPPKSPKQTPYKNPLYPLFNNLTPNNEKPPASNPPDNLLRSGSIPIEVSQALAPMMACMMEMKKSSKSPEIRGNLLQRSASSTDPFPGSYRTDLGRAEYGTLARKDSTISHYQKGRASSVSGRFPQRDNSLDRVQKLRRSSSRDAEINHRRRSQEPLILDVSSRCDSRMSNYSADVPDLEDADISNAMMMKAAKEAALPNSGAEFLSPSSSILQKKEKVLDEMTKEKLALQEAKSWLQTVILIILCVCAIIFIQAERRN